MCKCGVSYYLEDIKLHDCFSYHNLYCPKTIISAQEPDIYLYTNTGYALKVDSTLFYLYRTVYYYYVNIPHE